MPQASDPNICSQIKLSRPSAIRFAKYGDCIPSVLSLTDFGETGHPNSLHWKLRLSILSLLHGRATFGESLGYLFRHGACVFSPNS